VSLKAGFSEPDEVDALAWDGKAEEGALAPDDLRTVYTRNA
jgi:hypothetical protein